VKSRRAFVSLLLLVALLSIGTDSIAKPLQVRLNRRLEVVSYTGKATYKLREATGPVRVGLRLEDVGDTIKTGDQSSAVLAVDTGVGFVNLSENTTLQVQQLQATPDGGRITRLQVTGGQARLEVRPFTNPNSRFEIETPAGLSGVRGTQFGVSVKPNGKTSVATLEGSVVEEAQGQAVAVDAGFRTLVIPGEPPSQPIPLREEAELEIRVLAAMEGDRARIRGLIDPFNLLIVASALQNVERTGEFDITVPLPKQRKIQAVVVTPLGQRQTYELLVP
jgi:hypothetical protein